MEKLGSYKIIRQLNDRTDGVSYQAWDDDSSRTVVLRRVPKKMADDKKALASYARQQKRLALHDPHHATRFFGIEEFNDDLFFVREYVEGRSLAEILAEEPLGRLEFYKLAIQIAQMLVTTHKFGVVHGRLKADNVIVSERGQIRLIETGLPFVDNKHTSLPYRSPELRGKVQTSEAGDIFSCGVLFYQMLTGQVPWTDGKIENIDWILNFESLAGQMIDREIRLLIEKMISIEPENRGIGMRVIHSSLNEMLLALNINPAISALSHSEAPSRWSARSWLAISALFFLLIIFWLVMTTVASQ